MYSIKNMPPDVEMPPIEDLVRSRPTSWQGLSVKWRTDTAPAVVFVHQFAAWRSDAPVKMFMFGAKYDLNEAELTGTALSGGYFVEYFVASQREKTEWRICRLLQHVSPIFSDRAEKRDYVSARDVSDQVALSAARPPNWDVSEAIWPTIDCKPMMFIGQVDLPDVQTTRERLTWNVTLYLFWARVADADRFKVVAQAGGQSAEDYYANK